MPPHVREEAGEWPNDCAICCNLLTQNGLDQPELIVQLDRLRERVASDLEHLKTLGSVPWQVPLDFGNQDGSM